MDILFTVIIWVVIIGVPLFILYAIVSYIVEAIRAKKEGRCIRKKYKDIFLIGMILLLVIIAWVIFISVFSALISKGM